MRQKGHQSELVVSPSWSTLTGGMTSSCNALLQGFVGACEVGDVGMLGQCAGGDVWTVKAVHVEVPAKVVSRATAVHL